MFKFAQSIAEKLGISENPDEEQIARRDAGLASQRAAHATGLQGRKSTEQPAGYGRAIRRARRRDVDSRDRKQRRQAFRTTQQRIDFLDTAGPLAAQYFRGDAKVVQRVRAQAHAMVEAEEQADPKSTLTFAAALKTIEGHLQSNLDQFHALQAQREEADLRYRLTTKRGKAEVARRAAAERIDAATGHPVIG